MAISLGDNIKLGLGLPNDARYYNTTTNKPWTGVTEVNAALLGGAGGVRYTGLTVNIGGTEYWYRDGIEDGDLIEKETGGGTITGGTNGLCTAGADIALGGTLTGNTCVGLGNNIFCIHDSNADGLYVSNQGFSADICNTTSFITMTSGETYIWSENPNSSCAEVILLDNDNACIAMEYDNMIFCGKGNQPARYLADYSANISCLSIPHAGWVTGQTGGGLSMSGSTVGGLTTYVDANTICARSGLTFNGSILTVNGCVGADSYFYSTDTSLFLGTTGAGAVYIRPSGCLSASNQSVFTPTLATLGTNTIINGDLTVTGKTTTKTFQLTTGAAAGCVLTSDASGNATWETPSGGGVAVSGTTDNALTTYINASGDLCANPNLTYSSENLSIQGSMNLCATADQTRYIQLGQGRTGTGYTYIDFVGDDTYTDYGFRMIRDNTGPNADSKICHRGTGTLTLATIDTADICLCTPSAAVKTDCFRVTEGGTEWYPTSGAVAKIETHSNCYGLIVYGNTGSTTTNVAAYVLNRGGTTDGGNWGLIANASYNGSSGSGRSHGVVGYAGGKTPRYNYGVIGFLCGTQDGAGVVGTTAGNWTSTLELGCWAVYSDGPSYTKSTARFDGVIESCSSALQSVRIQAGSYYTAYDCSGSLNRMMGMASGSDLMTFGSIENTSAPICIYVGGGYKHEFCPNGAVDMYGPLTMTNGDIIFSQGAERTICVAEATDGGNGDTLNIFAGKGDSDSTPGYGGCLRLLGGDGGCHTAGGDAQICGGAGYAGFTTGNGGNVTICSGAGTTDGCVEIYHDTTKRLETTTYGTLTTGISCVTDDLIVGDDICAPSSFSIICGYYFRGTYACIDYVQCAFGVRICTTSTGYRFCAQSGCGCAVDWVATSDCRMKKNIVPISSALSTVDCLCGVCYEFCEDGTPDMGLIAQDVEKVEPRLVSTGEASEHHKEKYGIEDKTYGLKYDKFAGLFVEAIKELKQQNQCLQTQINALREKLNT